MDNRLNTPLRIHRETPHDEVLPPSWSASPFLDDLTAPQDHRTVPALLPPSGNITSITLADRLGAVLRGGAQAVGGDAAALYLLNDATTELRLAACWGLDPVRLDGPPRPLAGAVADLEALAGSAVVLEDDGLHTYWKVPETSGAAVCVPVATCNDILGTLWVFSNAPRLFDDVQTNLIEIIAGRLAAEVRLDQLNDGVAPAHLVEAQLDDTFAYARELQISQLPTVAPLCDGWEIAGWSTRSTQVMGTFHDWMVDRAGRPVIVAGQALESFQADPFHEALVCQSLRTAIRSHVAHATSVEALLALVNQTLHSSSVGDQFASLAIACLDVDQGVATLCCAGEACAVHVGQSAAALVDERNLPIGLLPESSWQSSQLRMASDEQLMLAVGVSDEMRERLTGRLVETDVAKFLTGAEPAVGVLREQLSAQCDDLTELRLSINVAHARA